jgi:hypothetical protein
MLQNFSMFIFFMIYACCLRNFIMKFYRYGIVKNTGQSRVYKLFGKAKNDLKYI